MSIINVNTVPGDMGTRSSRSDQAREAGEIIYRSLSLSNSTEHSLCTLKCRLHGTQASLSLSNSTEHRHRRPIPWDNQACCGIMSPVRRTFSLLAAFDLIFTFTLWVIYTQVLQKSSTWEQFIREVVHYSFQTSLFDTVLCAAWRCVPLLLAYALFRIRNPYVVAVTTFGTCAYVLSKVFIFQFSDGHSNVICYLLLITSFIISWIEVWFLDFKVLPQEQKSREQEALGIFPTERTPLLAEAGRNNESHDQYYSPKESYTPTPRGSDDELTPSGFRSPVNSRSRNHSSTSASQEIDFIQKATDSWDKAWEILHTEDGWKKEAGTCMENGIVYSQHFKHSGKIFKLEVFVDASPEDLFDEMVVRCDQQPEWNTTVLEGRTLQVVNENTDVYYNIAAEAAGGLVSSRDFVTLRHWKTRGKIMMSAGCAVMHPDMPANKKHVRGENRPGGWIFKPVPGNPNKCHFCWLINTDLKGWIPQYAVDQALSGTLLEFTKHVQKRMNEIRDR